MKYRKKPVIIDAYQTDVEMDIETLEGTMHADVGDYIITGVKGEKYPCKPDIFEQTYEAVSVTSLSGRKIEMKRTILQCDRCGNIITRDQYMQAHFPRFTIAAQYDITTCREIDLCNDCSDELSRWLEEGKNNEKDPT